ncbi:hypothetical protein DPMN_180719 [Dreissena polymorpha]|uniref:Uncharacterized protein n=1 Tax=Dreissena polymorpha TaxID=45954 RepID=A0A9D4DAZ1_DREPO|nr:hypothetical protein DPMN_180719 [Dreissena polymorpha]
MYVQRPIGYDNAYEAKLRGRDSAQRNEPSKDTRDMHDAMAEVDRKQLIDDIHHSEVFSGVCHV